MPPHKPWLLGWACFMGTKSRQGQIHLSPMECSSSLPCKSLKMRACVDWCFHARLTGVLHRARTHRLLKLLYMSHTIYIYIYMYCIYIYHFCCPVHRCLFELNRRPVLDKLENSDTGCLTRPTFQRAKYACPHQTKMMALVRRSHRQDLIRDPEKVVQRAVWDV